jgi:hypothetical protein
MLITIHYVRVWDPGHHHKKAHLFVGHDHGLVMDQPAPFKKEGQKIMDGCDDLSREFSDIYIAAAFAGFYWVWVAPVGPTTIVPS